MTFRCPSNIEYCK